MITTREIRTIIMDIGDSHNIDIPCKWEISQAIIDKIKADDINKYGDGRAEWEKEEEEDKEFDKHIDNCIKARLNKYKIKKE